MREIRGDIAAKESFPLAIIVSEFNQEITNELKKAAIARLNEANFSIEELLIIEVPGAVEIPLVAQLIAKQRTAKVIVALGAVIRGETSHYDYVCQQVSSGCQRVALDHDIPVIFGVLTTENEEQAWDRLGGKHGHKGKEAIDCALKMYSLLSQL